MTTLERVEEYRAKVAQNNEGMPEAGAIVYSTVYMNGNPINVTQRANNVYDAVAAFKMGLDLVVEVFGVTMSKDLPQAAPPKLHKAAVEKEIMDDLDAKHRDDHDFPFEPTYEDVKDNIESSEVTSINILPQPDFKTTVEFMKEGLKWPVAKINKWPSDRVLEFLSEVTAQDVTQAAEVKVSCTVFWKQGKEFAPGKHYKDILKVTA